MKTSLCNELFLDLPFENQCEVTRTAGLDGLEIAPYTIADTAFTFPESLAMELRKSMEDCGIGFAGLHWLLASPDGFNLTSRDSTKRREAQDMLLRLADFSDALGGGVLTLGGPAQRNARDGVSVEEAVTYLKEAFVRFEEYAGGHTSCLAIEFLSKAQSNVINTFDEARKVLPGGRRGRNVTAMFDFHNTADEKESWETLIRKNIDIIDHVHVNRMDGSCPGAEDVDEYRPAFGALIECGYDGWFSLEDFSRSPDYCSIAQKFRQFVDFLYYNVV